jgi:thiamine-monophosphate kinase
VLSGGGHGVILGVGDDAALVATGPGATVLTADLLVEGVHFEMDTTSPRDLGHKAVAVNVSDVAAMGGSPRYGLVSLVLTRHVDLAWVMELFGGMRAAADGYALSLVGGDLSRGERVVLAVTVVGEVWERGAVLRSGARPGDRIVVTGSLGGAAGGLLLSQCSPAVVARASHAGWGHELLVALARPEARVGEGQTLAQAGATAMLDLSDGLTKDLARICAESGVGARIRLDAVPAAAELAELARALPGQDPLALALSGGEDYELLATLPPDAVEPAAASLRERFGCALTEIGEIVDGSGMVSVASDGSERALRPAGWDHFA